MIVTGCLTLILGLVLNLKLHRQARSRGGGILRLYRLALTTLVYLVLIAVVGGIELPGTITTIAYSLGLSHLLVATLAGRFWGKVGFGTLLTAYLCLGGYLYAMSEIPYGDRPFETLSSNQPRTFDSNQFPERWITGLPLNEGNIQTGIMPSALVKVPFKRTEGLTPLDPKKLEWADLESLLELDSHIRQALQDLRQHQERELTDILTKLNESSVHGTEMRRNAISRENVDNLLRDGAISKARYQTFIETWSLADRDEQAFRTRQSQERFQRLLELLEDHEVTESHRMVLIRFMTQRFAGDVRLVQPLIRLYDALDEDYPRRKRMNEEFLSLYLQRREALLEGFLRIGLPSVQPLLDYRKRTIAEIRYSQYALDRFLAERFGVGVRPLYDVAPPVAIHDFLNREKYPPLGKFSGASYDQDYVRRSLIRMDLENQLPQMGESPMQGSTERMAALRALFVQDPGRSIDQAVIDPDPSVRAALAWVLAERKDPQTLPLVFEFMNDVHPEVRRLGAVASGNFRIHDAQGSRDPKFREIVRMLVNFRTNADAFSRVHALSSLVTVVDRQKALYLIDILLNDGHPGLSGLGEQAPSWSDDAERQGVHELIELLSKTPDELYVKTHALRVLIAMDQPDSLGILLHYLKRIYEESGSRPSLTRYIVPHMTLPQSAENTEDVIIDFARDYQHHPEPLHQPVKVLRTSLGDFYHHYQSASFFQTLWFLSQFDREGYEAYRKETGEHILLMRIIEYAQSTWGFWLVLWPLLILAILTLQYGFGMLTSFQGGGQRPIPNRHANPAADLRNRRQSPAAAIIPVKIQQRQDS